MVLRELLRPGKRKLLLAFILLPVILAAIVLVSLQVSQRIESWLGLNSNLLFELAFTLGGFLIALLIISKIAEWVVRAEGRVATQMQTKGADSSGYPPGVGIFPSIWKATTMAYMASASPRAAMISAVVLSSGLSALAASPAEPALAIAKPAAIEPKAKAMATASILRPTSEGVA
jgi:hypothetical protein